MHTQGFVMGQFGLLYALKHPEQVCRLLVLNTPVSKDTKLRPELAPYKAPFAFMRPGNVSEQRALTKCVVKNTINTSFPPSTQGKQVLETEYVVWTLHAALG